MSLIRISEVSKQEDGRYSLNRINFEIRKGEKVAIAGETGSGKSTLLKVIAGLAQPDSGSIYFNQERVLGPEEKLIPGHKKIAYLSQQFELPHYYTVANVLGYENRLTEEAAATLYEVCRIEHLLERDTQQLSGGEKQRIALARALIKSPEVLLLDEPFSNMDMIHKSVLKTVINDVHQRLGITCILVSHDPLDALSWADTLLIMKGGSIVQQGPPKNVYKQPVDVYTGALLGSYNLIQPTSLFMTLPGISLKGKSLFVRPEDFKIIEDRQGAMKGVVLKRFFYGSYDELEVQLSQTVVFVKTETCTVADGDAIYLTLSQHDVWYL